ncbi:3025_t:CDS:2, partial [Paraglomus occultum]
DWTNEESILKWIREYQQPKDSVPDRKIHLILCGMAPQNEMASFHVFNIIHHLAPTPLFGMWPRNRKELIPRGGCKFDY